MLTEQILKDGMETSSLYKAADQAFEIISKARRELGRPVKLEHDDKVFRAILDYLSI